MSVTDDIELLKQLVILINTVKTITDSPVFSSLRVTGTLDLAALPALIKQLRGAP